MTFSDIVKQAVALLRESGRMTYRTLKREFALDDEALEDLKFELIEGQAVAVDQDGKLLVWKGPAASAPVHSIPSSLPQDPASYTPVHLAERIRAEQTALEARGTTDGERKTITAMFADLKGSTALIEGLDPEDAQAIIDPALQLMMDAVHQYEGYVAQALGDGIFALFGAPLAHEDHPQRALYAALRMQDEMRRYGDQIRLKHGVPLAMRVGVNTGEVVLRSIRKEDLHTDYVPVGHATNLAARMEQMATPGSILVTEYTHRLTVGYFAFNALGAAAIKGVEAPLSVYEVLGVGPLRTRLQVATQRGLTRFVGRQEELEQLRKALEDAKMGHGRIVGVRGEPGVGKSRLFYEFTCTAPRGCLVLEAYSVSYGKASPYLPVTDLLKTYFQLQPHDEERQRKEKIMGKVLTLDRSLEDTLPYLFTILGVGDPPALLHQMDPQIRRQRTFEALNRVFLRESRNQPLILIFEDLHWIDSETQEFLNTLSESLASACMLLLVNYRPEYQQGWENKPYYTQLGLAPLGKGEAEELLTCLLGDDIQLKALKELILAKTEGTPFFMEEVVQTLVEERTLTGERGHYRVQNVPTALQISPTVQSVLAARIDRLAAEEKALVQQAAVLGREFPLNLLRHLVALPDAALSPLVASLQRKEFLYEQPAFPEVAYVFKHALTQEVAYGTVLQQQRTLLHERTAQAIEQLYQDHLDEYYNELAHHYRRSGNTQKAVDYLFLAGQLAAHRSAHADAISQFTTALALLATLPDTAERTQQELTVQIALGLPLMLMQGPTTSQLETTYLRARTLCQQLGDTTRLFPVLRGLCLLYANQGELTMAHELGEELLCLAQRCQDTALLLEAHNCLGRVLAFQGEFSAAQAHLEQSLALYDPQQHPVLASLYGFNPRVFCLGRVAFNVWVLGYPDRAVRQSQEALTLAHELAHLPSLGYALMAAAFLHQVRREGPVVRERTEALLRLASEEGFQYYRALGLSLQGWALAEEGNREGGISQMRQGQTAHQAIGAQLGASAYLAWLAEMYGKEGQAEEGLAVLGEAMAVVQDKGERFWEAELSRLKGELLLQSRRLCTESSREAEAQMCFEQALAIARQQHAKSWELRATMSLVRLWQRQGKTAEARQLLAEIYQWFSEGFETKDLQEANALLKELSR